MTRSLQEPLEVNGPHRGVTSLKQDRLCRVCVSLLGWSIIAKQMQHCIVDSVKSIILTIYSTLILYNQPIHSLSCLHSSQSYPISPPPPFLFPFRKDQASQRHLLNKASQGTKRLCTEPISSLGKAAQKWGKGSHKQEQAESGGLHTLTFRSPTNTPS